MKTITEIIDEAKKAYVKPEINVLNKSDLDDFVEVEPNMDPSEIEELEKLKTNK